jgi:hypothetical protein
MTSTYYDYSIDCNDFVSDLLTKLQNNGWTLQESGYTTVYPSGYSSIFVQPSIEYYASMYETNYSQTNYAETYIKIRMRSTYDATNHRPTITANGGAAIFHIVEGADYHASTTGLLLIKAWIWPTGFILRIRPDPNTITSGTRIEQLIVCAEGQAMDASANTMLLLAPYWNSGANYDGGANTESEVGMKSIDLGAYVDNTYECHFIHTLGNGDTYLPITLGFDVSSLSNKLRTMPFYAWKYRGDGTSEQQQLMFQITQVRFTFWQEGSAVENDTFTVGSSTYKLVSINTMPNQREAYGRPLVSKVGPNSAMEGLSGGSSPTAAGWNYSVWLESA